MADIKFFLKFGERRYLERLKEGHLYFSNARTFRRYEEELLIKGQGDRLEGGSYIIASNITMIDRQTGEPAFTGIKGNMIVHYAPIDLLPVFCVFCCYEKDCITNEDGSISIRLLPLSSLLHFCCLAQSLQLIFYKLPIFSGNKKAGHFSPAGGSYRLL